MTKSIINPKLLKVEIHFDDNDCLENVRLFHTLMKRLLNLLTIMGQILWRSLLRVVIGAEIKVSSFRVHFNVNDFKCYF